MKKEGKGANKDDLEDGGEDDWYEPKAEDLEPINQQSSGAGWRVAGFLVSCLMTAALSW